MQRREGQIHRKTDTMLCAKAHLLQRNLRIVRHAGGVGQKLPAGALRRGARVQVKARHDLRLCTGVRLCGGAGVRGVVLRTGSAVTVDRGLFCCGAGLGLLDLRRPHACFLFDAKLEAAALPRRPALPRGRAGLHRTAPKLFYKQKKTERKIKSVTVLKKLHLQEEAVKARWRQR